MSQNTLIEKIKNDAAIAVDEIKAQGAAEVESIKQAVEAEVAELKKNHETNLEKKKAQIELVAVSKAKQTGNIAVQTAKREQINTIFTAVRNELMNQSADAYVKFFAGFVSSIVPTDVAVTTVSVPSNRTEETKQILQSAGLSGEVTADNKISAGLIVTTNDGVYDITLDRLLNERRAELEMVIVNQVEG